MNPGNNFQSHIKKSTSQEITNTSLLKRDNQINKRNINPIRTRTPFHEENKSNPLEMQNSSMESRRTNYNRKYTSNTHNPLLVINSRRNKEEISKNDNNNNNTILYISKVKRTLNNQYNLSDDNLLKFRNSANSNTIINNNQLNNNRKSNQLSIDFNSKNNISNITSKYLIKEELNNKNYKNLQTKTTRVLKIKTNQIDNSNNSNKYPETNRRLNLKSVEPQKRNHNNTAIYTSNINNKNDQKKSERQNSYNNHKLYTSHYTRRNQRDSNTNIINSSSKQNTNNIKTTITTSTYTNTTRPKSINNNINIIKSNNNHTIISSKNNTKEKEIEKKPEKNKSTEKPKEIHKTEYINKNPNITITSTYNNNSLKSQLNNNDFEEEEEEDFNKPNNTMPSLMFDDDMDFGEFRPPIKLSSEIFGLYHPKFKPSIHSLDNEFKNQDDFIKAYAYNTSEGNIREYNEDTITVTKINLNQKDKNDYFYFFAVYDGHGGNGCSLYLKNNLHKNITEFSTKGIKTAIEITENTFLSSKAIDYNYDLLDTSGSCGVILLIKKNKCIIANIGDSRLVMFKNKRVVFSTSDHKPNTYIEKHRIESQGGSVYQTTAAIPIYQNGKLIEIPWRVCPGGLSVSRTFGDIESKDERFGGKKGVVVALPDISEFELNDEYNFIVIGCDGIFDVLSNGEIIECIKIVLKINKSKNKKINELCGDFASMIIKSALAKESFDNVSCIVIVFNLKDFI